MHAGSYDGVFHCGTLHLLSYLYICYHLLTLLLMAFGRKSGQIKSERIKPVLFVIDKL